MKLTEQDIRILEGIISQLESFSGKYYNPEETFLYYELKHASEHLMTIFTHTSGTKQSGAQ